MNAPDAPHPRHAWRTLERDLWPMLGLFWLVSLGRVIAAFVRHETFGPEASLAVLAVVLVPLAVVRHVKHG
jgi:hypothetical protein